MNPEPKRRTRATRFIWQAYDRMKAGGITIEVDSPFSWVTISAPGEDDIFMQGDEADSFIKECRKLWNRYPSLPMDVCEMVLAERYTDLWS